MSSRERFFEEYRARMAAGPAEVVRPDRQRMVALTAAFTPMMAVAALPLTAVAVLITSIVGNLTVMWVGVVAVVVAVVALGYLTARRAAESDSVPATRGWRRWLPLGATIVVVAQSLAEMTSGGRAPGDPVIVLWFASIAWVFVFFPLATGAWGPARRALWAVAPVVTFVVIVFVWTQGLFWLRFRMSVPELDAVVEQIAEGKRVPNGTKAGGFAVQRIDRGHIRGNPGCDVGFWITGWHDDDTRYIAHCVGQPQGGFKHLEGDWWQLEDKRRPSDL